MNIKHIGIIFLCILAVCALFTYMNDEDTKGPCPHAVIYETQIEGYGEKLKNFGTLDALFNSDEVLRVTGQLKDSLMAYKTHVRDCQNPYCMKDKQAKLKSCDEGIACCQEMSDAHDIGYILGILISILCFL